MHIGVGVSLEGDPARAAKEAFSHARQSFSASKIDLAIAFSSIDLAQPSLLKTLSHLLSGAPLIGSSGPAIITQQGIFKHGLVLMLLGLSEGMYLNVASTKELKMKSGLQAGDELGEKLLYSFANIRRSLAIILSDALVEESSNLIFSLQERLGKSFPVIGGSNSDNFTFLKTKLYYDQEFFNDGCVGLLWGGKLNFGMGIKHGWKPIGKPHIITSSHKNIVETIDGQPAAKLYEEYLGCTVSRLRKELKHISIFYPIGIYLQGEEEYLLRNVLSVETDNSLRCQGNIPEGSTIRLMISTKETCLEAAEQAIEEAKKSSLMTTSMESKKEKTGNFVLIFSSIARLLLLKRDAHKELDIIKKHIEKNTPIIGLYTYGELGPLMAINYLGKVYLHNQTIAVVNIGG
jgi:hypothetical protein